MKREQAVLERRYRDTDYWIATDEPRCTGGLIEYCDGSEDCPPGMHCCDQSYGLSYCVPSSGQQVCRAFERCTGGASCRTRGATCIDGRCVKDAPVSCGSTDCGGDRPVCCIEEQDLRSTFRCIARDEKCSGFSMRCRGASDCLSGDWCCLSGGEGTCGPCTTNKVCQSKRDCAGQVGTSHFTRVPLDHCVSQTGDGSVQVCTFGPP